ncbi:MAG: hypothetical protein AAF270_13615 [Pseudomonadota bacterium]
MDIRYGLVVALAGLSLSASAASDGIRTAVAQDQGDAQPYYDRHLIDVSNLRDLYEGMMIGDMMIHADAMFDAKTKWKMTLYQMIRANSGHHQARSAFQLSHLGVPLDEIYALWSDDYIEGIRDDRVAAAFRFIDAVSTLPASVDADTHAMLRNHYTDRQIAELMEMAAFNVANAVMDNVLPIPTDAKTVAWANENLVPVGWGIGDNKSSSSSEQRAALFAGDIMDEAYQEILASWNRADLTAPAADLASDWLNTVTGYEISQIIMDSDKDGVEDPFDHFPIDPDRWARPGIQDENMPSTASVFPAAAFDTNYYVAPPRPQARHAFSDRIRFDTEWTRQNAMGTSRIENYFAAGDRALPMKFMWQVFVVYQLSSGCVHCQVHGTRWLYEYLQGESETGIVSAHELQQIYDLFDFERADRFTPAERAALRFARDAGPLPARVTAAHIEELRRYYANREIQELMMIIAAGSRLSAGQQANVTVTDRTSMAWALRYLPQVGWRPGGHLGLPQEQRRLFMSEIEMVVVSTMMSGAPLDFATEWVGLPVPLFVDADGDGVEDAFDGYPNDPSRWEDTDRDGIEDARDNDIDGDGLTNRQEQRIGSFPYKADSDADGVSDLAERDAGTDPIDPHDF